ncbi:MAG: metalloprotease TldD [Ahrensia sp.]
MTQSSTPAPDLLARFDISKDRLTALVGAALAKADDGELFVEHAETEMLGFDNGRLKTGSFNTSSGFGLRSVAGEAVGYAQSDEMSEAALLRASDAVGAVTRNHTGTYSDAPARTNRKLYTDASPIGEPSFEAKAKLLAEIDAYLRDKDPRVRQVSASIAASWQVVEILRADGHFAKDVRPMTRINISVIVGDGDRQETGSNGMGGRQLFGDFIMGDSWKVGADDALRQALVNLDARPAPAGTMDIVLGNGWPGVMLHEAVGHGLEGDFNRKGTSAFAELMGQQVAAKGVTVVDDGTIDARRGSISIDDEGTPSAYNVLIDDGKLVGFMQDRQNARLMGVHATGNGRRQSYAHVPMPRMTNTYMLSGDKTSEEIISSVKKGLYAVSFGGGQVDITSGKFVFGCTEAYMIEDGKITYPVKGAMLIGNGPDAMHRISMVGNDLELDKGVGTCGKAGQGVPVGIGQPHLRMDQMTVGGTEG